MKRRILKLTLAVLLFGATTFAISNSSIKAENPSNAKNAQLNFEAEQLDAMAGTIYCGSWSKVGEGSECCGYIGNTCVGNRYWDRERRYCYNVLTNQSYAQHRNTNYRTAGPCN